MKLWVVRWTHWIDMWNFDCRRQWKCFRDEGQAREYMAEVMVTAPYRDPKAIIEEVESPYLGLGGCCEGA